MNKMLQIKLIFRYVRTNIMCAQPWFLLSSLQGHKSKRKKVAVQVNWQRGGLGVSLRGGKEYGIGLYIAR